MATSGYGALLGSGEKDEDDFVASEAQLRDEPAAEAIRLYELRQCTWRDWRNWWDVSCLWDWGLAISLGLANNLFNYNVGVLKPFVRHQVPGDSRTQYPLRESIVSTGGLYAVAFAMPAVALFFANLWNSFAPNRSRLRRWCTSHDVHHAVLGLFMAFCWNSLLTDVAKLYCGRLRPDFDANPTEDSRKSFFSGHASWAFTSATFTSLYLAGKLGLYRERGGGKMYQMAVCLLPIFVAAFVAMSRTRDYHHDFSDISTGALCGTAMAFMGYMAMFRSPLDQNCNLPKARGGFRPSSMTTNEL